jgi:tRNA/tmRNA/rRNA uracil-C5-methylase (TrmA/RlmC/RlmD family)
VPLQDYAVEHGFENREVHIDRIVNGGYGLGKLDGRVLLVPFSVPGDRVRVKPLRRDQCREQTGLFYEIEEVVKPSPMRVKPTCPVFGVCGGCDFDHITYRFELETKRRVFVEDVRRIGGYRVEKQPEIIASLSEYRYRNHAQVKTDEQGRFGFFKKKSHEIVPLPSKGCLLLQKTLNRFVLGIQRGGPLKAGSVRFRSNGEGQIFCKGAPCRDDDVYAYYRVGDREFRIGIDDFFQVNGYLNERWIDLVKNSVCPDPGDVVYDLFCGSGLIALSLAPFSKHVIGIEANGSAVRNAVFNASQNGVENVEFLCHDLTTQTELSRWKVQKQGRVKVVVDPPRTGLEPVLIDAIAGIEPDLLVYASCNSATFSRDLKELVERGYNPEAITIIDMFPRTRHIETVARFVK